MKNVSHCFQIVSEAVEIYNNPTKLYSGKPDKAPLPTFISSDTVDDFIHSTKGENGCGVYALDHDKSQTKLDKMLKDAETKDKKRKNKDMSQSDSITIGSGFQSPVDPHDAMDGYE